MQSMFIYSELLARFLPVLAVTLSLLIPTENRKLLLLLLGQYATWFIACTAFALYFLPRNNEAPQLLFGILRFDFISAVMAVSISTIACIVLTFAERNFLGNRYRLPLIRCLMLLASVASLIVAANAFLLFWFCWFGISILLWVIVRQKSEFRSSARQVLSFHTFSDVCLALALGLLAWHSGQDLFYPAHPAHLARVVSASAIRLDALIGFLFVLAMVSKSALFPFDSWLVATIDAPTPPSALLHAGIVNVSAILAARVFSVVVVSPSAHVVWIVWAAFAAFIGTIQSSVRSDIKNDLVASTSAQMGWMMLQCACGNFAAAILHLIAHGFYKALLFLTAHSSIDMGVQKEMYGHEDELGLSWSKLVLPAVLFSTVGFWLIRAGGVHSQALLAVLISSAYLASTIPSFNRIGRGYLALAALMFGVVIMASGFASEFFSSNMVQLPDWSNSVMSVAIISCVLLSLGLSLVRETVVGKALFMAALNGFYVGDVVLAFRLGAAKFLQNGRN